MKDVPRPRPMTRRAAIATIAGAAAAACAAPKKAVSPSDDHEKASLPLSLAEWSFHRPLFAGEMTNLDFAAHAQRLGFKAIEYVNQFFKDKALDRAYLDELNRRARDAGVYQHLIMVDGEGRLGAPDKTERTKAVKDHSKWLNAAATLGCATIRVNASSEGTYDEQMKLAADGLRALAELAAPMNLNVVVENHGGYTSNGKWLSAMIRSVNLPNCGTLPDFGNFCYDWSKADDPKEWYDRYLGVQELMPLAKAVSAKSYDFDGAGNETTIDYPRMMKIVWDSGYRGWVGIEYEGEKRPPDEGIMLTKKLIERSMARIEA